MQLAPGLIVAERFRLDRVLGHGGMGEVWLARHIGLDVPCAVKFIHPDASRSPEIRARFEREAKAAAQLRSPHVVQILDHGVWSDRPYIAMELLDGEDLAHRLSRRKRLSAHETMAIASQVGRALAKAHAAGLVHRDLKPANIFLVRDDDREITKVLDFGIAKTTAIGADGETKTGAVLGTPFYMSPEQARGNKGVDHRSDLWALAVVVFKCLTGRLPFESDAFGDLLAKIMFEPIPVPSAVAEVPPGFDAWWARAAARDPAQRFQTAKELTDALGLAIGVTLRETSEVGVTARTPEPAPGPATPAHALELSTSDARTVAWQPTPSPHVSPIPMITPVPLPTSPQRTPMPATPMPATPMPQMTPMPATPMPQMTPMPATPMPQMTPVPYPAPGLQLTPPPHVSPTVAVPSKTGPAAIVLTGVAVVCVALVVGLLVVLRSGPEPAAAGAPQTSSAPAAPPATAAEAPPPPSSSSASAPPPASAEMPAPTVTAKAAAPPAPTVARTSSTASKPPKSPGAHPGANPFGI